MQDLRSVLYIIMARILQTEDIDSKLPAYTCINSSLCIKYSFTFRANQSDQQERTQLHTIPCSPPTANAIAAPAPAYCAGTPDASTTVGERR